MKRLISLTTCLVGIGAILFINGCNKNKEYDIKDPGSYVHFIGAKSQSYIMNVNPAPKYTINLGTTNVSSTDRTVTYKITSPTGAVAGTHYTVTPATITIPAGQT